MHDGHGLPGTDIVVDGVRLHVVRHGREGRRGDPVILFIHDVTETGRVWCDVARDLEHDHRCLIPDLAGCGRSEHPDGALLAPASQARLLLALLDACKHDRAVLVAHGTGAVVAAGIVDIAPERVDAVVLIGSALHPEVWPTSDVTHLGTPVVGSVVGALRARSWSTGSAQRGLVTAIDDVSLDAARRTLGAAGVPRLVVWGADDDRLPASYGSRLASELAAPWVPVDGGGRDLPTERPERVAEEISGFLADLADLADAPDPAHT